MEKERSLSENKMRRRDRTIIINGLVALIVLSAALIYFRGNEIMISDREARLAYHKMEDALRFVARERAEAGHVNNRSSDPFGTMLIGPELSDITTTVGNQEAKRTSLHPMFAALIVKLMKEAGVSEGDRIALGCSGSFPGLLIAALSAAEAMNLEAITILTLGASSYGATDPDFTILDLHMMLWGGGFTRYPPAAVSPGGNRDTGTEMDEGSLIRLMEKAEVYGIPFIYEKNLVENRLIRDSLYSSRGVVKPVLFINSGGSYANMGSSNAVLSLRPGLTFEATMPGHMSRGVIHDMLENGIPVIHLLNIKGIAVRYGIPWDSFADSEKRETSLYKESSYLVLALSVFGLLWFLGILVYLGRMPDFRT